jgi:SAM-dependent methyltransferase
MSRRHVLVRSLRRGGRVRDRNDRAASSRSGALRELLHVRGRCDMVIPKIGRSKAPRNFDGFDNHGMSTDSANAYEKHARAFLSARDRSTAGAAVIKRWARSMSPGTEVLEIGCGGGLPVTRVLVDTGLKLWAVDSSPTLLSEFRVRFPDIPVECARALESTYFGRKFGAVIAIGLIFLLQAQEQAALIHRASELIVAGGRFLFTAPLETGTWADTTTGHECRSLGRERYESILAEAGFRVVATYEDEGQNNYYEAERLPTMLRQRRR